MTKAGRRRDRRGARHTEDSQLDSNTPYLRDASVKSWQDFVKSTHSSKDKAKNAGHYTPNADLQMLPPSHQLILATGSIKPAELIHGPQTRENPSPVSFTAAQYMNPHHVGVRGDSYSEDDSELSNDATRQKATDMTHYTASAFGTLLPGRDQQVEKAGKVNPQLTVSDQTKIELGTSGASFAVDTIGFSDPTKTDVPPSNARRSASSFSPASDDEVIIFSGRKHANAQSSGLKARTKSSSPQVIEDGFSQPVTPIGGMPPPFIENPQSISAGQPYRGIGKSQFTSRKRPSKHEKSHEYVWRENEIQADYISNLQNNNEAGDQEGAFQFKFRDLGGLDGLQDESEDKGTDTKPIRSDKVDQEMQDFNDWDSCALQDFDGFSTSSEPLMAMPRILGRRLRESTVQYLVVDESHPTNDARWLPVNLLSAPGVSERLDEHERKKAVFENAREQSDDSDDSLTLDAQLVSDIEHDLDAMEDDKIYQEWMKARMSDVQIARLLSKQAELGLIGDEIVLFTGEDLGGEAGIPLIQSGRPLSLSKQKSHHLVRKPSILHQDSYDGFDVMDRERPSLQRKPKKGRRGGNFLNISDQDDLQRPHQAAWETDRTKKRLRKAEREELRALGLLGKKVKPDLSYKFIDGMTIEEVKSEIKAFLKSSRDVLSLPPMAHKERKVIHEIANRLRLKSKSVGSGNSRFPVLYKSSRTLKLTDALEASVDAMFALQRFLPRMDKARKRGTPILTNRAQSGGMTAAASYRDGEIVGVGAPELGLENKGRAMLEKMGWSTGTALGAVNNKGITQPVAQVVKTSKAGLG